MVKHILFIVGDGYNFTKTCDRGIYSYNSKIYNPENFDIGDILWFITTKSKFHVIAIATFERFEYRQIGELVSISETNEERGWILNNKTNINVDIYFSNIYNISELNFHIFSMKGQTSIRNYNPDKIIENLHTEYDNIVKYSKVRKI